tara:strand:- start:1423 stop:1839 length:417 start_codon:yes stop_codon:yes gene_type:complete
MIELLLTCSLLGTVHFNLDELTDISRVSNQCELIEEVQEWIPLINIHFKEDEALALTVLYCESSGREKVIGRNNNGSYDTGLFQINSETEKWLENSIYNKELDMLNAETNVKAASWIVRNIGDWSWWNSSKHCWGKYG